MIEALLDIWIILGFSGMFVSGLCFLALSERYERRIAARAFLIFLFAPVTVPVIVPWAIFVGGRALLKAADIPLPKRKVKIIPASKTKSSDPEYIQALEAMDKAWDEESRSFKYNSYSRTKARPASEKIDMEWMGW